jgi:single-strand DNA-binding protein
MSDTITLTGLVATAPRHIVTSEGLPITSFRLASAQRRFDRSQERWIDGDTNWYTVTSFRQLAVNAAGSVAKGDRVVVSGRLRIREWENGERGGTNVDIEADAIGHDLAWGTSRFSRSIATSSAARTAEEPTSTAGEESEPTAATDAATTVVPTAPVASVSDTPVATEPAAEPTEAEPTHQALAVLPY